MSFLISASAVPLSRISVMVMVYFSRACWVSTVSGHSTSMRAARALERAALRASVYSEASSSLMALVSSAVRSARVMPGRTSPAKASSRVGRVRVLAWRTLTSKMARFPARVLSLSRSGKLTPTVLSSPTLAPTSPSTNPSMYRPSPKMTSTSSPLAAAGRGSALVTPSSAAMYPTIFTTAASPIAKVADPSSMGDRIAYRSRRSSNDLSNRA
mmetsp:Transcript_35278/g.81706  ORF Transcript_35278/g.81706 Transcript_35278/m.81706 type:complete len:213 (+) Transcript_35278:758-1396(+)